MLAGCSSTLLSPRHRLRSEASAQFQACHIPTMSTQRLDLPCSFPRKDSSRSQPVRPVNSLSIEKPIIEAKKTTGCSLRQNIKLPPVATEGRGRENRDEFWDRSRKKRFAGEVSYDEESYMNRAKRKRSNADNSPGEEGQLSLAQFSSKNFWFHHHTTQVPFSLSCSGEEEERVCFAPSDVIAPPLPPLSNIPWFDSVVTEITTTGSGKKNGDTIENKEASSRSSSTSTSDTHGLVLAPGGNPGEHEIGNGSSPPNPSGQVIHGGHNGENNNHVEHECVELVSLLVACAEQIGSKNISAVNHCLVRLGETASPRGITPLHRLVAYFTEALALRAAKLWPQIFHVSTAPREIDDEGGTGLRLLNQVGPIPKFIHFTSNEILLKAFEGKERVHIIDFDVRQGLQWPSLFQSLASRRPNPPSHVRITGVGESKRELIETGDRLAGFAAAMGLPFEFHLVVDRLEDVRLWMLHVKEGETVAVNCMFQLHKMLYDGSGGAMRDFMGLIRSTNAEVVVVGEQEGAHNEGGLDLRLSNSLRYYSAVFDSIDSSLPLESSVRVRVEEMFGREIRNIIACEGRERLERHETFGKWRELIEQEGFRCVGVGERELLQGQMMLRMYSSCENYRVEMKQESSGITLSWLDQPLYTVSAWKPVDVAGSSLSAYSQPS